jgi:hypothetical protein
LRDLAEEVLERRANGMARGKSIASVALESKMSERHVATCLRLYNDAKNVRG